ncbi:MAG TPA: glycosyltransferase family 39 protein [Terriglobia bacterium]|nr:glycosyltransferase family 39 protein [Terriglobia bacterium]
MNRPSVRAAMLIAAIWLGVFLLHYPWRCLPYYWDEAGYYALAALDFYRHGLLIPESTQKLGHTPLLTVLVGTVWHVLGLSPCWARLAMMLVAATAIGATYALGRRVAGRSVGVWAALLLAVSPLFFAQSSMLHIDLGPTLFVTLALASLLPRVNQTPEASSTTDRMQPRDLVSFAAVASLAILSKETAVIVLPVAWAYAWRVRHERRAGAWFALGSPLLPLAVWALYYHHATGFWTGNTEYLRYNLYSTLNPARFFLSLLRRLYQFLIAGFDWILVVGGLAGAWWERRSRRKAAAVSAGMAEVGQGWVDEQLPAHEVEFLHQVLRQAGVPETSLHKTENPSEDQGEAGNQPPPGRPLASPSVSSQQTGERSKGFGDFLFLAIGVCAVYLIFHSLIGGALLRRYLLPVFPAAFVVAVAFVWKLPKKFAQAVCFLAAAYFMASLFINPPYPFPYEDNLAYADFVRLHQDAAHYLETCNGQPRILTAWPATGELTIPFLGYVDKPLRVVPVDGFATADFSGVSADSFELACLYSRKWEPRDNWLARFPFLGKIQQRYFDYAPQIDGDTLATRYHLRLVAHFERRGQWVRIYSK